MRQRINSAAAEAKCKGLECLRYIKGGGQSGLEYLMTYGWSLIVVAAVIGVVVFVTLEAGGGVVCKSQSAQLVLKEWTFASGNDSVGFSLQNASANTITLESDCVSASDGVNIKEGDGSDVACSPASVGVGETFTVQNLDSDADGSFTLGSAVVSFTTAGGLPAKASISCSGSVVPLIVTTSGIVLGSGTALDPYQINDAIGLQQMEENLSAYYILTDNIAASGTSSWNGGLGFDPIGDNSTPFTGNFDGNGYAINGLYINRAAEDYVGLFGYTSWATVEDVGLNSISVTGNGSTGGLSGHSESTTVDKVYTTGTVTGNNYYAAGIIGEMGGGSLSNSYSTVNVTSSSDEAGGLIGYMSSGTFANLSNCYATGNVVGFGKAGGLVGETYSPGSITNCFSTGSVTAGYLAGGAIGLYSGDTILTNLYWNNHAGNPANCYEGGDMGCTAIADDGSYFYSSSNPPMDSWNFTTIWQEVPGSYPTLR